MATLVYANSGSVDSSKALFSKYRPALFQVRVVDDSSNAKSSTGTAFLISSDGLMLTNYHVVAEHLFYPESKRLEYEDWQGRRGTLTLLYFDVVHDLALIQRAESDAPYFDLNAGLPQQGETIYSMGNPHDLGMIVVPGTFNGLQKNKFYPQIHFTGAINSGMSGGPVVNQAGKVVGINVATMGNQIGFLVPIQQLHHMMNQYQQGNLPEVDEVPPLKALVAAQLYENQAALMQALMDEPWQPTQLGASLVPLDLAPFIACWGGSNSDQEDNSYELAYNQCQLNSPIYIKRRLTTNRVNTQFRWLRSDQLSPLQFSQVVEEDIATMRNGNRVSHEDVTPYACQSMVTRNAAEFTARSVLCTRQYVNLSQLYDALFVTASIDRDREAIIAHFELSGFSQASIAGFTEKFMESLQWQAP